MRRIKLPKRNGNTFARCSIILIVCLTTRICRVCALINSSLVVRRGDFDSLSVSLVRSRWLVLSIWQRTHAHRINVNVFFRELIEFSLPRILIRTTFICKYALYCLMVCSIFLVICAMAKNIFTKYFALKKKCIILLQWYKLIVFSVSCKVILSLLSLINGFYLVI